jgi:hypothetical protein
MRAQFLRFPLILHTLKRFRPQAEDSGVAFSGRLTQSGSPSLCSRLAKGQENFGGFLVTLYLA